MILRHIVAFTCLTHSGHLDELCQQHTSILDLRVRSAPQASVVACQRIMRASRLRYWTRLHSAETLHSNNMNSRQHEAHASCLF